MAAWPAELLPVPVFAGMTIAPGRRARRFEPDEGPPKQRTMTTAALTQVTLVYMCTDAQRGTIMSFFAGDGAGGGAWFTFPQPFTGTVFNARFVVGSEPKAVGAPPKFTVTVTLEVDGW